MMRFRDKKMPLIIFAKFARRFLLAALLPACLASTVYAKTRNTRLYEAARAGDAGSVQALLDQGANPNARNGWIMVPPFFYFDRGETPLCAAVRNDHADVARLLLKKGADREKRCYGYFSIGMVMLEYWAKGPTPLLIAIGGDHADVVKVLLQGSQDAAIADIEHQSATPGSWNGSTPKSSAAYDTLCGGSSLFFSPAVPSCGASRFTQVQVDVMGALSAHPDLYPVVLAAIGANPQASGKDLADIILVFQNKNTDAVKSVVAKSWSGQKPQPGAER